nr:hypothetical protein Itr_chr02CG04020 [Ipomoea trifida]
MFCKTSMVPLSFCPFNHKDSMGKLENPNGNSPSKLLRAKCKFISPGNPSESKNPGIFPFIFAEFAEKFCRAEAFLRFSGISQAAKGLLSISTDCKEDMPAKKSAGTELSEFREFWRKSTLKALVPNLDPDNPLVLATHMVPLAWIRVGPPQLRWWVQALLQSQHHRSIIIIPLRLCVQKNTGKNPQ